MLGQDRNRRTAVCYYYCYFGNNQDETTPFLCWVLSQLCRQARRIPDNISGLRQDGCRPSDEELLKGLQDILGSFDAVYVVIDAVDESNQRENLVGLLATLVQDAKYQKIQLLATSREYEDIRLTFSPLASAISMANEEVEQDIRTFVRADLGARSSFKGWSQALLDYAENTLAREAKGM